MMSPTAEVAASILVSTFLLISSDLGVFAALLSTATEAVGPSPVSPASSRGFLTATSSLSNQ